MKGQQDVIKLGDIHQCQTRDVAVFASDPVAGQKPELIPEHRLHRMKLTAAGLDADKRLDGVPQFPQVDPGAEPIDKTSVAHVAQSLTHRRAGQADLFPNVCEAGPTICIKDLENRAVYLIR